MLYVLFNDVLHLRNFFPRYTFKNIYTFLPKELGLLTYQTVRVSRIKTKL